MKQLATRRTQAQRARLAVSQRQRKKVEMLFAHLMRILRLDRLRLRPERGKMNSFWPPPTKSQEIGEAHPAPGTIFAA
jgi:hypothetical protein